MSLGIRLKTLVASEVSGKIRCPLLYGWIRKRAGTFRKIRPKFFPLKIYAHSQKSDRKFTLIVLHVELKINVKVPFVFIPSRVLPQRGGGRRMGEDGNRGFQRKERMATPKLVFFAGNNSRRGIIASLLKAGVSCNLHAVRRLRSHCIKKCLKNPSLDGIVISGFGRRNTSPRSGLRKNSDPHFSLRGRHWRCDDRPLQSRSTNSL